MIGAWLGLRSIPTRPDCSSASAASGLEAGKT
jgi:hypothetical protein